MKRYLISYRADLLGSRTRSFLYAWQYSLMFDYNLVLFWDEYYAPKKESYAFADLFDVETFTERTGVEFVSGRDMSKFNALTGLEISSLVEVPKVEKILVAADGKYSSPADLARYQSTHPVVNYKRHKHPVPTTPAELFARIPLNPKITAALKAAESLDIRNGVALHLRRGDYLEATFRNPEILPESVLEHYAKTIVGKYISDNAYARNIPDDGSGIFLFSDVDADRARMEDRFGSRVIDVHTILDQNEGLTTVQRAFVEILLMSRAGKIVGSRSNFCRLAALIGDVPLIAGHVWTTATDAISDMRSYAQAMEGPNDPTHVLRTIIGAYKADFVHRAEMEEAALCEAELASPEFAV